MGYGLEWLYPFFAYWMDSGKRKSLAPCEGVGFGFDKHIFAL